MVKLHRISEGTNMNARSRKAFPAVLRTLADLERRLWPDDPSVRAIRRYALMRILQLQLLHTPEGRDFLARFPTGPVQ